MGWTCELDQKPSFAAMVLCTPADAFGPEVQPDICVLLMRSIDASLPYCCAPLLVSDTLGMAGSSKLLLLLWLLRPLPG